MFRGRRAHSQKGQALLEMALVTPLIVALALGVIELGRYAYVAILVGSAARAGAAYGAQGLANATNDASAACPSASSPIQQAACSDFLNNGQDPGNLSVGSSISCGCDSGGTLQDETNLCSTASNSNAGTCDGGHWVVIVSVEATGTFQSLFKYPGIPSPITVQRTATMRVAQQ
jgi:Flp pilus assembly protein TadG